MMIVASTAPAPAVSLRERKKLACRRLLRRVALDLVAERGFANVTVEDIAEAAELSPRTFFNYFPSKEAALFGTTMTPGADVRERIVHESPGAPALDVLRAVMITGAEQVADDLTELGGDPADWLRRMRAVRNDPHLRAAHAARMANIERTVTEALAERLGTDPDRDPYPGLLCAVATGVFRTSMAAWASSGGTVPLERLIGLSFQALADGLPERSELRQVMANALDGKDDH